MIAETSAGLDVMLAAIFHVALFVWLLVMAVRTAIPALGRRRDARPNWKPARPSRQSRGELARVIEGARTRGFYRSILAGRLRNCARDRLGLDRGLPDAEALHELRAGGSPWPRETLSCALEDHFVAKPRAGGKSSAPPEPDFLDRADRLLSVLEEGRGPDNGRNDP